MVNLYWQLIYSIILLNYEVQCLLVYIHNSHWFLNASHIIRNPIALIKELYWLFLAFFPTTIFVIFEASFISYQQRYNCTYFCYEGKWWLYSFYIFQHLTWNFDNIVLEILFFAFVLGTVSWFKGEVDKLEYSKEVLGSLLLLFDKMLRDNKLGIRTKGLPWWLRQ